MKQQMSTNMQNIQDLTTTLKEQKTQIQTKWSTDIWSPGESRRQLQIQRAHRALESISVNVWTNRVRRVEVRGTSLIFKNQIFSSLSPGVWIMTRCWGAEAEALWTVGLVSLAESFILQRAELRQPVRPDQNEMHRPCGESVRGYTAVLWGRGTSSLIH